MFDIYCTSCDAFHLIGTRSLTAFRNTDGGPVGRATCPNGHEVIVDFSAGRARKPAVHSDHRTTVAA